MKKILYFILPISLLTAACSKPDKEKRTTSAPISVTVSSVGTNAIHTIQLSGTVESKNSTTLSTRMMGYVEAVLVDVGDNVKKGQLLIRINSSELQAKKAQVDAMISESSAAFKSVQKDLERFTRLHDQKSATDKELEQMQLQFESIKAKRQAALQMRNEVQAMEQFISIKAPYDGQITQKIIHVGDLANPGMPLMKMEQEGQLMIVTMVPDKNRSQINEGTKATVEIVSSNLKFETTIKQISLSSTQSAGQYIAKLTIPAVFTKNVYPGMYATIKLNDIERIQTGLNIPTASLVKKDQLTGVYVYSNHKAFLRWLKVGEENASTTEVLTGLKPTDTIVLSSDNALSNGAVVTIK